VENHCPTEIGSTWSDARSKSYQENISLCFTEQATGMVNEDYTCREQFSCVPLVMCEWIAINGLETFPKLFHVRTFFLNKYMLPWLVISNLKSKSNKLFKLRGGGNILTSRPSHYFPYCHYFPHDLH
jgi:hypothetical protein